MSSIIPPEGLRPLPERPNLEFERKRAKRIVREQGKAITLADAQRDLARTYGFKSWRKLVAYYDTWARHERAGHSNNYPGKGIDRHVAMLLRHFEQKQSLAGLGAMLSAFIPRFYGLSDAEIFASHLTEDEARTAFARSLRHMSWSALRAFVDRPREHITFPLVGTPKLPGPIRLETMAPGANDRERIRNLVAAHPDWLATPGPASTYDAYTAWHLLLAVIRDPNPRGMLDWVQSLGVDTDPLLDNALLGSMMPMRGEHIRVLLELGANPAYVAHNGYSVLEHAVVRYVNGGAVDLISARVPRPQTFWVAAGVGDVDVAMRFVDGRGVPTEAARRNRPDMTVLNTMTARYGTTRPDAPDLEVLWEAFTIAALNGRTTVMDAMLKRGYPVDYSPYWFNALHLSTECKVTRSVEFLLQRGADPDHKSKPDSYSPRDVARIHLESEPNDPIRRGISDVLTVTVSRRNPTLL